MMIAIIILTILLLAETGGLGWLFLQYRKQKKISAYLVQKNKREHRTVGWNQEENEKLELMKKRVDLNTLQSQINPHFLYNTLDSIRSKALLDGQTELAEMTRILAKFFRYCISNKEPLVRIREEMDHVQDYYYIQKYRFEDRFDMTVTVDSDEVYDYYIPRMTLQPLVENAMVHGLEKTSRKGLLELRFRELEDRLEIIVADNGVGMTMEQLDQLNKRMNRILLEGSKKKGHNSIAINNVNARIKMTFGEEYGIHYHSMPDEGTDAIVTLPKVDDFMRTRYENKLES